MEKKGSFGGFLFNAAILGAAAYGVYKLATNEKVKQFFTGDSCAEDGAELWCEDDIRWDAPEEDAFAEVPAEDASADADK